MTKKKTAKKSVAFDSIRQGLIEARGYARGKTAGAQVHEVRVAAPDVAAIRAKTGLSQTVFAKSIGVAVGTLQGWEQGRRRPDGPARVLLALIDKRPRLVQDELAA
ncbi:MAG: helix-turn-helix domain-containing protein [Parvularculaceae bacterium]